MTVKFEGLTMNQLAERNAELVTQIADLQRKVEALAVENNSLLFFLRNGALDRKEDGLHSAHQFALAPTATKAALAEIRAQVWLEAKDFTKSMLACDSVDHIDAPFDGKVQQLRKEAGQ